jgi:hypothetical protein
VLPISFHTPAPPRIPFFFIILLIDRLFPRHRYPDFVARTRPSPRPTPDPSTPGLSTDPPISPPTPSASGHTITFWGASSALSYLSIPGTPDSPPTIPRAFCPLAQRHHHLSPFTTSTSQATFKPTVPIPAVFCIPVIVTSPRVRIDLPNLLPPPRVSIPFPQVPYSPYSIDTVVPRSVCTRFVPVCSPLPRYIVI